MCARRVVKRDGWESRIETAWEEVVASRAGREAEKTDADELIRCTSASRPSFPHGKCMKRELT